MKHTPGPWRIGLRRDKSIWLSIGDPKTGPHFQGDLVASIADARLIASAPDLLEACQEFVRKCECGEAKSKRSYAQMKAVIARAESQS